MFKVVCINNEYPSGEVSQNLVLYKTYVVNRIIEHSKSSYYNFDDFPLMVYDMSWFVKPLEYRRMKIKKLKECLKLFV